MNYEQLKYGTMTEMVTHSGQTSSVNIPVWVNEQTGIAYAAMCSTELDRLGELEQKLEAIGGGMLGREALQVYREDNEALRLRCSDLEAQLRNKDQLIESLIKQNEEKQSTILEMFNKVLGKMPSGK